MAGPISTEFTRILILLALGAVIVATLCTYTHLVPPRQQSAAAAASQ